MTGGSFPTSFAPDVESSGSVTPTLLAALDSLRFVRVTKTLNGSPDRTMPGTMKETSKYGLRTRTAPEAFPLIFTGPVTSPSSTARMSKSIVWKPSDSPRIRNSASPCSAGESRSASSSVPGSPSGPTPRTGIVSGWRTSWPSRSSFGRASGSSFFPVLAL